MSRSTAWKGLEKRWRDILLKYGVPAYRKTRGNDWSVSDFDVGVTDHDWIISDAKYSIHGFKVNRLWAETKEKYAKKKGDEVILITRGFKEKPQATVDAEFMARLLACYLINKRNDDPN